MPIDRGYGYAILGSHHFLRQPDILIFIMHEKKRTQKLVHGFSIALGIQVARLSPVIQRKTGYVDKVLGVVGDKRVIQ